MLLASDFHEETPCTLLVAGHMHVSSHAVPKVTPFATEAKKHAEELKKLATKQLTPHIGAGVKQESDQANGTKPAPPSNGGDCI